jgi:hypothetical protein
MASTVSVGVFRGFIQIGTTLTFPNNLNIIDFNYITGKPGDGPIFPRPRIDVPSVKIAFKF